MADTICVKGAILYLPHSSFYIDVNLLKAETWHFNAVSIILFTTKPEESLDANVKTQEWRNVFVQCQKVAELDYPVCSVVLHVENKVQV